ncbi:hypothetical protein SAMN05518855_1001698 [Paenibacillus sp. CF384]|nr:hypothetical protein SAMN05518855_1001698 [Paenibacillus sp. CF384]
MRANSGLPYWIMSLIVLGFVGWLLVHYYSRKLHTKKPEGHFLLWGVVVWFFLNGVWLLNIQFNLFDDHTQLTFLIVSQLIGAFLCTIGVIIFKIIQKKNGRRE